MLASTQSKALSILDVSYHYHYHRLYIVKDKQVFKKLINIFTVKKS